MFMHKPRGLNPGENYACNRMAVRRCFEGQDITVMWGSSRNFSFDARIRKKPDINGTIVASLVRNRQNQTVILSFYIISDSSYGDRQKKLFEEGCLPHLREWLLSEQDLSGGFDRLLVAWTGSSFCIHELHYV